MEINGVPIVDTPPGQATGAAGLAENFDNFLTLLTTQLQHQDPLSPLDTTEFTNQLTNFAQVEQIISSNSKLDRLIELQNTSQLTTGVSYIGKLVEATGDQMLLQDGSGSIGYELNQDSARTTITILNQFGTPVLFGEGNTAAGRHIYQWDGINESGSELPDGIYGVLVNAFDTDNNLIESTTSTFGRVTGVEVQGSEITLIMGPMSVDLEDVQSVLEAPDTTS